MNVIEPCGHRVLVKPESVADVDPAIKRAKALGFDMSSVENNKREQEAVVFGIVVSVGPTAWAHESLGGKPWAKVGDKVVFAKFSGKKIELPNQPEMLVMNDEDIVAVIREGE